MRHVQPGHQASHRNRRLRPVVAVVIIVRCRLGTLCQPSHGLRVAPLSRACRGVRRDAETRLCRTSSHAVQRSGAAGQVRCAHVSCLCRGRTSRQCAAPDRPSPLSPLRLATASSKSTEEPSLSSGSSSSGSGSSSTSGLGKWRNFQKLQSHVCRCCYGALLAHLPLTQT